MAAKGGQHVHPQLKGRFADMTTKGGQHVHPRPVLQLKRAHALLGFGFWIYCSGVWGYDFFILGVMG